VFYTLCNPRQRHPARIGIGLVRINPLRPDGLEIRLAQLEQRREGLGIEPADVKRHG
jgi:hypothetical protein